jgi:hypothetical protein
MCRRWYSTVAVLMNSFAAASRLVSPSATSLTTWVSCAVSARDVSLRLARAAAGGFELGPGPLGEALGAHVGQSVEGGTELVAGPPGGGAGAAATLRRPGGSAAAPRRVGGAQHFDRPAVPPFCLVVGSEQRPAASEAAKPQSSVSCGGLAARRSRAVIASEWWPDRAGASGSGQHLCLPACRAAARQAPPPSSPCTPPRVRHQHRRRRPHRVLTASGRRPAGTADPRAVRRHRRVRSVRCLRCDCPTHRAAACRTRARGAAPVELGPPGIVALLPLTRTGSASWRQA